MISDTLGDTSGDITKVVNKNNDQQTYEMHL